MTDFEEGFLLGILVGEGHFECGCSQPSAQVTVRMHVRQAELFHWLCMYMPGSALYGPYHHNGRHYLQWMMRGRALREELVPFLKRHLDKVDSHIRERITRMFEKYQL
jgi:hypothetical protein